MYPMISFFKVQKALLYKPVSALVTFQIAAIDRVVADHLFISENGEEEWINLIP